MRDVGATGVGGPADRQRELGDAELGDQRRTFTCEWDAGVGTAGQPRGCLVDRLGWVLLGPGDRGDELGGLRAVRFVLAVTGEDQHVEGVIEVPDRERCRAGHGPIQAPTTDSPPGSEALAHRGILDSF